LQLKKSYQQILDTKDELEEHYSKAREESQKVPKLMKQIESLQNALEVSKAKVSFLQYFLEHRSIVFLERRNKNPRRSDTTA
jgi:hypothetical protein